MMAPNKDNETKKTEQVTLSFDEVKVLKLGPTISSWFVTLMIGAIPVVNLVYFLLLSIFSKSAKRRYAIASLLANLLYITVAVIIFVFLLDFGVEQMDAVLEYMEML